MDNPNRGYFAFLVGSRVLVGLCGLLIFQSCSGPVDSTDPPDGRSGLSLFTDHQTGCQYLGLRGINGGGGIIPRLDGQGRHVGCRP